MTLRDFRIDVVDVPTIEMTLHCVYPAYTRREPLTLPVTGSVQLPQGTTVTVEAKANKDLVEVPISSLVGDKPLPAETIHLAKSTDRRHFSYRIDHLDADRTLLFTLVDSDGIKTKEPVRLNLNAVPDEAPRIGVHLRGIGTKITPNARLPAEGEIIDDYGVAKAWFEYTLDQGKPVKVPFRIDPRDRTSLKIDRTAEEALDFKDHPLKVGRQMLLTIMAQDNCSLKRGPNVAPSERFELTVVTPDQLMSTLEARELTLRLRLEQIAQDLTSTRDQLAQLDFSAPPRLRPSAPASAPPPRFLLPPPPTRGIRRPRRAELPPTSRPPAPSRKIRRRATARRPPGPSPAIPARPAPVAASNRPPSSSSNRGPTASRGPAKCRAWRRPSTTSARK